ncbi:hypothetical protein C5S53_01365 [Methanophagales archaeon]|nr:hypothetical protein C5S53_01365 [Methanophagales archaeon]
MANCIFCDMLADRDFEYFSLDVCRRCHTQLGLNSLKNVAAPADEYMQSLVKEDEKVYVDALNMYATLFSRTLAPDLFGIFFTNLEDEEMDDIFIISMIIAARAIWLYGHNRQKRELNSSKIHALHVLGNLVDVAVMAKITDTNWHSDLDEETNILIIERDIDRSIVDILLNLNGYDDGTLHDLIIESIHLIHTPELFR